MNHSRQRDNKSSCQSGTEVLRRKSMRGVWYVNSTNDLQGAWVLISEIASSETSGDYFQFGASRCSYLETYQGMHNMSEAQGTFTATYR